MGAVGKAHLSAPAHRSQACHLASGNQGLHSGHISYRQTAHRGKATTYIHTATGSVCLGAV